MRLFPDIKITMKCAGVSHSTALGTFIGAFMLAVLKVGMVVINVDSFWQYVVTGIIIIVASYFEFIKADFEAMLARRKNA